MVGVIVALFSEAKNFIEYENLKSIEPIAGKPAYIGKIKSKDVVLVLSNVGKVNASLVTQALIDKFSPEFILNFGTAGCLTNDFKICDYVSIKNCAQYDFDLSKLDNVPVGFIQGYDKVLFPIMVNEKLGLKIGNLATGDRFNDSKNDLETALSIPANVKDMEGGAIAEVCESNNVKLYIIKGITDVANSNLSTQQFLDNLSKVCQGFTFIIEKFFENL